MIVSLQNVTVRQSGKVLVDDVTWEVKKDEHWAIFGLNGSGKTTLLNVINGYIFASSGSVEVLGAKFGAYDLRELRKRIGWVSSSLQEKLYGSEKVEEIVLSGAFSSIGLYEEPSAAERNRALELMELMGIESLTQQTYRTLSQGEKQKTLIARGLMARPQLLILDEPCTGLDVFARLDVVNHLESIIRNSNGTTLIYVTHHVDEISEYLSHTLLLQNGKVHSSGANEVILTSENLSDFLGAQVRIEMALGQRHLRIEE